MKKCEVIKQVTITAEPGSEVIISDRQYEAAKNCLKEKGSNLKQMAKSELLALAAEKGFFVTDEMTKTQIIEMLER